MWSIRTMPRRSCEGEKHNIGMTMIKKVMKYRLVGLLSLGSVALTAGGFFWMIVALGGVSSGPFILHFNDMQGITSLGNFWGIVWMGIIGIVIVTVNLFVALVLEERDGVLGKIVAVATFIMAVLLFLAFAAIIKVN